MRRVGQKLVNRKIRDANFRRQVREAYDDRCAVTGLRIINGGGRSEVQAAHIWGVGQGGHDVVQNGIALSGTAHWLFDRHLISVHEDYGLLVSDNKVPAELRILFERQLQRIHLPKDERLWPHRDYAEKQREGFMAGARAAAERPALTPKKCSCNVLFSCLLSYSLQAHVEAPSVIRPGNATVAF